MLYNPKHNRIQLDHMSRSVPWRNKPSTLITQMIPVANELKLYLVNQIGPTSFLFKDDTDNKFKVIIGSTIACSCGVVSKDHCIHSLYVLLKKFKVPENNPILWQASYIDSELEGLVQMKYVAKKNVEIKKYIPKRKGMALNGHKQEQQDFPPLEEDSSCPICYQDFESQCYSTCGTCRKPLHTKCLKVWVAHKQVEQLPVSCPMCRTQFVNPMVMIYHDLEKWEASFSMHKGTLCRTCGVKNIKGLIYRCLLCPNTDLCKMCYEGNQHSDHERFFVKEMATDSWKMAPLRVKKTRKQLFQPIKQLNTRDLPPLDSKEFIISLFPTLKQFQSQQSVSELGIVGNDILSKQLCYKCRTLGTESMRRLNCGHSIHEECLESMISRNDFVCEVDQEIICPGYVSAMGIKVVRQKSKKMADCVLMKNEEEINKINKNMGVSGKSNFRNQSMDNRQTNKDSGRKAISKERNFRILKKNILEKREQDHLGLGIGLGSPIMVMGFGQQQMQQSNNQPIPRSRGVFRHHT